MNRIEFSIIPAGEPDSVLFTPETMVLRIDVDGVDLAELARRAELRSAEADGQANLAGAYSGLQDLEAVCWPSRHFLGEPTLSWFADGDTALLGCTCGEWGCWPLCADVAVADATVTWSNFRNGHRRHWDLAALGPFVFAKEEYERAVRSTERH